MEKEKKKLKIPPHLGEIFAIITSFGLAGLTFYTSVTKGAASILLLLPLVIFYSFIGFLRLIILLMEIAMVKKNIDPAKRFRRERVISRLTGLIIILFNSVFFVALMILINRDPSEIFTKINWTIYAYIVFAVLKLISSFVFLAKARKSFSPYRETICFLSFISSLMTFLTLEVALIAIFAEPSFLYNAILIISALAISAAIYIMAIIMIISRRFPKEIA